MTTGPRLLVGRIHDQLRFCMVSVMEKQRNESGNYCCSYAWLLRRNFLLEKQTTRPSQGWGSLNKGRLLQAVLTDSRTARIFHVPRIFVCDGGWPLLAVAPRLRARASVPLGITVCNSGTHDWSTTLSSEQRQRFSTDSCIIAIPWMGASSPRGFHGRICPPLSRRQRGDE
ncbi:hypothetical protein BDW62DRAFT_125703 [Aspergillus aurantiobrunneus]